MKLSSIKVNGQALTEGVWVDSIPQLPGVRLKVRADRNTDYRRLEAKLQREIPREGRVDGLDPADEERIRVACLIDTVLVDWDGLEEEEGTPLVFSPERRAAIMTDPDNLIFVRGVEFAAMIALSQKRGDAEADAGN